MVTFTPPPNALGADLFWWRETGALHTMVTVHALSFRGHVDDVVLHCVLFDAGGTPAASWQVAMEKRAFVAIDSQRGLITIFMVQNAGWRNDDGKKIQPAFTKAALDAFGKN